MSFNKLFVIFIVHSFIAAYHVGRTGVDDLDNFINPEDLDIFAEVFSTTTQTPTIYDSTTSSGTNMSSQVTTTVSYNKSDEFPLSKNFSTSLNTMYVQPESKKNHYHVLNVVLIRQLTETANCFGLGSVLSKLRFFWNLRPKHSDEMQVEFYMQNRQHNYSRVRVMLDDQFGLEWTYFDPQKTTIVIVHGFLSYSKASWVVNMTKAFLEWDDVNVITVDWSRGGNTWKYWRAVVNTRTVGSDLARFLQQIMKATGAKTSNFHFIGHSLGAHICSFASNLLGGVRRITGLDPAQPCFITTDFRMLLDKSDADFVDVIHTNGRELSKIGLGVPNTCGHQDFYPNGGMKQPGCHTGKSTFFNKYMPISKAKLKRAICNHGRAYLLFTESLKNNSCSLVGHKWNMSYSTINSSITSDCSKESCSEMGVRADIYPARGSFYVVTTAKKPFCETVPVNMESRHFLINDLKKMEEEYTTEEYKTTTVGIEPAIKKKKAGFFASIFG